MTEMNDSETVERFVEGLKMAASRCRELGAAQGKVDWLNIAASLDQIRSKGLLMMQAKELSREQILASLNVREKNLKIN